MIIKYVVSTYIVLRQVHTLVTEYTIIAIFGSNMKFMSRCSRSCHAWVDEMGIYTVICHSRDNYQQQTNNTVMQLHTKLAFLKSWKQLCVAMIYLLSIQLCSSHLICAYSYEA